MYVVFESGIDDKTKNSFSTAYKTNKQKSPRKSHECSAHFIAALYVKKKTRTFHECSGCACEGETLKIPLNIVSTFGSGCECEGEVQKISEHGAHLVVAVYFKGKKSENHMIIVRIW